MYFKILEANYSLDYIPQSDSLISTVGNVFIFLFWPLIEFKCKRNIFYILQVLKFSFEAGKGQCFILYNFLRTSPASSVAMTLETLRLFLFQTVINGSVFQDILK